MIWKMVIHGKRIEEEESDDTNSVESYPDIASTGYSDLSTVDYNSPPGKLISDSDILSPGPSIPSPSVLALLEKLKRRRIENLFIKKVIE